MNAQNEHASGSADKLEILKRLAMGTIRQQGNRFIKELLRANGIALGQNKEDFEHNLLEAIQDTPPAPG
jgi:hypothetical protein